MEGTKSEEVFDSLNTNPQLFINTVFNNLDDLVHQAFHYFLQAASSTLNFGDTDRSEDLTKGTEAIRNAIQANLDKRLSMWEEYCLKCCFEVPEDFSMPNADEQNNNILACQDVLHDPGLDAELDSLRSKISVVGKESAMLEREVRALEQQNVAKGHFSELIMEAMQSYDHNFFNQMLREMATVVSELNTKVGNLKKRRDNMGFGTTEKLSTLQRDSFSLDQKNVFADAKLEDLQEFLAKMKKIQA